MKRKLDENNVPAAAADLPEATEEPAEPQTFKFEELNLDPRLLQAVSALNFSKPTPVQAQTIPLALDGRDILARSKTGSGKTAAYILPVLQSILRRKKNQPSLKWTSALILVPTRELADQVAKVIASLTLFCAKEVRAVNLTQNVSDAVQRSQLVNAPDLVIATPARATEHVNNASLSLEYLTHLVIDEADLVLSYGHEKDIRTLAKTIPRGVQTFLMSATLSTEVDTLKGLFCRNPAVLHLEDGEDDSSKTKQLYVRCAEDEKFLLVYVMFRLNLIRGKCIIFVGDIDRSYRLKLFLEQFGVRSCVLNSELPVNSRIHVVEEFNKDIYDIIIAADDQEVIGGVSGGDASAKAAESDSEAEEAPQETQQPKKKRKTNKKSSKDYGISRGIDFQNVSYVLNFDLPGSSRIYTHRIGRTARAGKSGTALSFVVPTELYGKHKPTRYKPAKKDEAVLSKILRSQLKKGQKVEPYELDRSQFASFQYRTTDALRAVTKIAIHEARVRELKSELLKSDKLKRHFEENPDDLRHLRHDGESRTARIQPHLKHVPEYLMPSKGKRQLAEDMGFVGMRKSGNENRIRKARANNRARGKGGKKGSGKKHDPLKSFKKR